MNWGNSLRLDIGIIGLIFKSKKVRSLSHSINSNLNDVTFNTKKIKKILYMCAGDYLISH